MGSDARESGKYSCVSESIRGSKNLAEADGNRTHRPHGMRATGFEDQGGHQATFASAGVSTFADSG